jgi:acyl-lipid omega-6 desaturase (Delta-12 desaturase)
MKPPSALEAAGLALANPAEAGPPPAAAFAHHRPQDWCGALHVLVGLALTGLALLLSASSLLGLWLLGQGLLAIAFLFWFAVLHEAGHKTLFRTLWLNALAGHLAGFLALIPFPCWKLVHARHHRWTGWQDLDPTTATLVPRQRSGLELLVVRTCWWLWVPLVAVVYRLGNYWNLLRLRRVFPLPVQRRPLTRGIVLYLAAYALLIVVAGPGQLLAFVGLGLYLTLALQDLLILSQHTHIPMQLSEGRPVPPISPAGQEIYTRSLGFPAWFAHWVLLNLDAHELHHMYPRVPGCYLHRIPYRPHQTVPWWRWVLAAKSIRGDVLLFQNSNQTGYHI